MFLHLQGVTLWWEEVQVFSNARTRFCGSANDPFDETGSIREHIYIGNRKILRWRSKQDTSPYYYILVLTITMVRDRVD